jgi:hypothetical protein
LFLILYELLDTTASLILYISSKRALWACMFFAFRQCIEQFGANDM